MSVRVSVVVSTYRRPHLLERCLKALLMQQFPPHDYEVIIVDDDTASVETKTLVNRWGQRASERGHCVRYIAMTGQQRPRGPASVRNVGWRAARGEIIAFTDDDCVPDAHWLRCGMAHFTDDVDAISGRIHVPLPPCPTDYAYDAAQLEQSAFATANCFYRRAALEAVGGFDERFTAAWREDSDLYFTLRERGFRCITVSTAVVIHPVRTAHWGVSLFQQRKSMFNALLYKKHPTLYRQTLQPRPPWLYYETVGALLLALVSLLVHFWFFMTIALIVWVYLSLRFCLIRLRHTSHAPSHILEMLVTSLLIPPLAIFWRLWGALKFRVWFL